MSSEDKIFYCWLTLYGALVGVGGYFVIDALRERKKLLVGIIVTVVGVVGLLMISYTPRADLRQHTPSLLLIVTVAVLGYDIYLTRSTRAAKPPKAQEQEKGYEPRTNADISTYNAMQGQFDNNFSWAQKVALTLIYQRAYMSPEQLKTQMVNLGFGRDLDEFVVQPIQRMDREFVDLTPDGTIRPNPGRSEMVTELLRRFKRHAL